MLEEPEWKLFLESARRTTVWTCSALGVVVQSMGVLGLETSHTAWIPLLLLPVRSAFNLTAIPDRGAGSSRFLDS